MEKSKCTIFVLFLILQILQAQVPRSNVQVKISDMPFPVSNAQQISQVVWTMLGTSTKETIYCVSEAPVSQLRFVCMDCFQKNITDMVDVLSNALDLTRSAGFPTVALRNIAVNPNWTGATIMCQAALGGETIDSAPAVIDVRYLRQPHVVDISGHGPILIASQGYRFYVECVRNQDGTCQPSSRRKLLRCAVQAHPPATVFRWLKNGILISGNGAEITIGTEMVGQSVQCSANNDLYVDSDMPVSQAVQIDPYTAARIVQDNFQALQNVAPFQAGNHIDMNQQINLGCQVEGNPRPIVYWKIRRSNGQIDDAACGQGFDGQYQEIPYEQRGSALSANIIKLNAICSLRIANYSFTGQYWCSACSFVSQGSPECTPPLDSQGGNVLTVLVQGPPMLSDVPPTLEKVPMAESANINIHYCADPIPKLPRDVIFSVDENELQVGQSWENFQFEGTAVNNTVPSCHIARLLISPLMNGDRRRQVVLKVQNTYGSKHMEVDMASLFGVEASSISSFPVWGVIILVVVCIAIIALLLICYCIKMNLLCFGTYKGAPTFTIKNKTTVNNHRQTYTEDMPRALYQASVQPAERLDYEAAVQAAYCDSRMSSV